MAPHLELFSVEASLMRALIWFMIAAAIAELLALFWPGGWLAKAGAYFDRVMERIFEYGRVLPFMFLAGAVAILAPVYEGYLDAGWTFPTASTAAHTIRGSWDTMLTRSHGGNAVRNLIDTLQWSVALLTFWLYSLIWARVVTVVSERGGRLVEGGGRAATLIAFVPVTEAISRGLDFIGKHPFFLFA